ncbi:MAG: DEAD/DEAH box helicase family protein [Anaerolineae bacterium]|nr:DEAD/DEAH box helicase family protein [Anaerolineae bacterium]
MPSSTEAQTRRNLIDPALKKAGWDVSNPDLVRIEIPVDGFDPAAWQALEARLRKLKEAGVPYDAQPPKGITDYALYRENGEILAVIEAKKTSVDPRLAVPQAEFYVTELEKRQSFRPFAFMTNGHDTYFWDVGRQPKRAVYGFFSRADLENQLYIRRNQSPLATAPIDTDITDRPYQVEAIRRVGEAFEQGKRKALIVMATGTGKTRVSMSLADLFLRTNQARRILFVADRDALVQQALDDGFKAHIPDEPCTRIYSHDIDTSHRLYVVTLQTMANCFRKFTPGFFDLIIFDEVHRSIFNRWNEPLQYFDGRLIGLTATPAEFIDRNTFLTFDCFDGVPTTHHSYRQAIDEGYLADYVPYAAQTHFQRAGIRGAELSEEDRNALIEQGLDPDEIDYAGTDLERVVTNRDTLRRQWQEIMHVCYKDQGGQLPGKTIVFALTQEHALRLADAFEEVFPQYPDLLRVITYGTKYARREIRKFKHEDKPRLAISVDMLETGVDIPEVVNLVFMKPVHSRIKLEQMIGRGTRHHDVCRYPERLPGGHKDDFLIIDFWQNEFNKPAQEVVAQSLPVLVSLFNTRLKLLAHYLDEQDGPEAQQAIVDLRAQVSRIPTDSIPVINVWSRVEPAWGDDFWGYLTAADLEFLHNQVGPLLRYAPDVDVKAETFTGKVERLKLQMATGAATAATARSIAEDVSYLPNDIVNAPAHQDSVKLCRSPKKLQVATPAQLTRIVQDLAGQMRRRRAKPNDLLQIDLPDEIELRGYVFLMGAEEPVYAEEYRRRVEDRILDLAASHPTLQALVAGRPVSERELLDLERTLRRELGGPDLYLHERNIRAAYRDEDLQVGSLLEFLSYLLDIEGLPAYDDIVRHQFSEFVAGHAFSGDQVRFLRAVENVFLQRRHLQRADLYGPRLAGFGQDAVERLFTPAELDDMLALAATLTPDPNGLEDL